MSHKVSTFVWKFSQAKYASRLVLVALADFADDEGYCWPSVKTIAKKARVSERTAQYGIRQLIEIGELAVDPNCGPNGCNVYRVLMPCGGAITDAPPCNPENKPVQRPVENTLEIAPKPSGTVIVQPSEEPSNVPSSSRLPALRHPVGSEENPIPTETEVTQRFISLGMPEKDAKTEAPLLLAFYDSNGWRIGGRSRMISWKGACVTWMGRWQKETKPRQPRQPSLFVRERPSVVLDAIQRRLDGHVANPKSACYRANHSEQDKKDFEWLRARKKAVTDEMIGGGVS